MSKLGLAACSILTLGCVCLLVFSAPVGDRCPWVGNLGFEAMELSSSPRSTESIMLLFMEDCEEAVAWRAFRTGNDCSFDGGTGGCSGSDKIDEFSPRGPRGPRESSTASNRVA